MQAMYRSLEKSPRTPGMDLICTVPTTFSLFGLYPSSLSKSAGFVSLAGEALSFLYLMLLYFYDTSMFIYRFSSNFVEKGVLKKEQGGRDVISCLLPCVLYCMEGEFEQIITKIRLSIKDNKN